MASNVDISVGDWIALSVLFAIALLWLTQMPKYWRGDLQGLYEQGSQGGGLWANPCAEASSVPSTSAS